jgi:ankyrin repeat protein
VTSDDEILARWKPWPLSKHRPFSPCIYVPILSTLKNWVFFTVKHYHKRLDYSLPLLEAARKGHFSTVKLLIDNRAKLNDEILFKADNFCIVKYLLKKGANPKATESSQFSAFQTGNTLLHQQCNSGNLKNVKYLIQLYKADVTAKNDKGQTPLHLACKAWNVLNVKIVKFLIEEQEADPAITCNSGKSAVHYAAEGRDLKIVRYLIEEHNLDPAVTCNKGKTALHYAAENWDQAILVDLIDNQRLDIDARDSEGKTALNYCLEKLVKEKTNHFQYFEPIALMLARKHKILKTGEKCDTDLTFDWIKQSYSSDMKMIKEEDIISCLVAGLQGFQTELDKKELKGISFNPLLHLACDSNRVNIAEYVFNQDLCYIETRYCAEEANLKRKLLLKSYLKFSCEFGLLNLTRFLFQEINARFKSFPIVDESLLKTACLCHRVDILKYLLEEVMAEGEATESFGSFPLHFVCKSGSPEMIQYLIQERQLDVETKDKEGQTPLHIACEYGMQEIVEYLIEEKQACTDAYMIRHGRNLLQTACKSGSLELVKYIQDKLKQDVNAQDENGSTALHLACERKNVKVVKYLISDMKADLHLVDNKGRTPLHVACESKRPTLSVLKFLVNKGAAVLAKDKEGETPLQAVMRSQMYPSKQIITFLKAATKR